MTKVKTLKKERGTKKLPIKAQDPRDIIGRCLTLERLRTVPVAMIEKLVDRDPHYAPFLKSRSSAALDKNGNPLVKGEINWEFALFDATQRQILDLFNNFTKVRKNNDGEESN